MNPTCYRNTQFAFCCYVSLEKDGDENYYYEVSLEQHTDKDNDDDFEEEEREEDGEDEIWASV